MLKYIILPGINDTKEDFGGIIKIMEELETNFLIISRNFYNNDMTEDLRSAEILKEMLKANGFESFLSWY